MFAFGGADQRHPLGGATSDADSIHREAYKLAAVRHQEDFVRVFNGKGSDDLGVRSAAKTMSDETFAAAPGDPVLVGRCALAQAVGRGGENELLLPAQLADPIGAEGNFAFRRLAGLRRLADGIGHRFGIDLFALGAPHGGGVAEIGAGLGGAGFDVMQNGHSNHRVPFGQVDAADAG